ncbi:MAG: hypothetical protein DMG58_15150, partial [Acidobacteria bacterium]
MVRTSFQRLLFVLAVALCFAITLAGQLNRGVIEGVVTDSQDAIVPDVDVRVVSLDTAVSLPAKTNNAGYYRVVDLVPGKYRVLFDAKGFSELALTDIQVPAGSVIRADAQLRVGTASQSVQVTAEVPLVETGASDFSTTIDTRTIQDLPLQGRDLQQLIFLVPGVVGNGPPGSSFGFNSQFGAFPDPTHLQGTNVSVNGGQGGTNAWYLDGNLNLSGSAESIVVNPSPDAVTEFQTITNAFSAEYGRSGGAVFNVVLKSGTNRAHGNLYEYVRNSHFNARNPFTSIDSVGKVVPQDQLHFNNFGGTFGGPVVLPRLYNGKNKTFFFFSWDTSILHLGSSRTYTVPTPLMRQGNFSEDPNASYGIWNPYSTVGPDAQGQFQRSAFGTPVPGNPYGADGCLNSAVGAGAAAGVRTCNFATQLPASMLNPTAMFFMNKFPMPNYRDPLSGCPLAAGGAYGICNNFLGAIGSSQDSQNISLKIDHAWSDKSRYFAEWLFNPGKYNNFRLPWTGPTFPASGLGFGSTLPFDFRNQIIALGNTYTFRPTFINEFRASFSRQFYTTHPETTGYPDSVTELSSVEKLLAPIKIPLFPPSPAPSWSVSSPGGGSNMDFGPVGWTSNMTATEAYTVLDNVTKILGKHTIKTGFTYRLQHSGQFQSAPTNLGFYGGGVVDPQTGLGAGSGLAQFMLGAVQNDGSSYATGAWQPYMRHRYWGFFAQDDFRVTSKLTLNFGLRYDIFGAYKTRQHPNARFCLSCPNPDTGVPGIVQYEGDPGFPMNSDIVPPNFNDWGPRVNFSWAPFNNRKTVIRGGYDVFYSNAYAAQNSAQAVENGVGYAYDNIWQGSINPSQCAPLTGQCVAWSLGDTSSVKGDLTIPVVTGTFPAQQKEPLYATYMNSVFKPAHDPMVQSWTLEVQRELPGNFAVTIGYVGTHGTHLVGDMWHNYNYVSTANRLQYRKGLSAVAPISDYYSGKTASKLEEV